MNGWISPLLLKCFLILLGDNLEKEEFFGALPQLVLPSFTRIWPRHRTGGARTLDGCTSIAPLSRTLQSRGCYLGALLI